MKKSTQKIKIFDAEIDSSMSLTKVLKICKKIENAVINDGEDVEVTNYTFVHVRKDITKTSQRSYEIIFHKGDLQSVEWWDIHILYSRVPRKKMRLIQT